MLVITRGSPWNFGVCPVSQTRNHRSQPVSNVGSLASSGPKSPSTQLQDLAWRWWRKKSLPPKLNSKKSCHFYNGTVGMISVYNILYMYIYIYCIYLYIYILITQLINVHNTHICSYNTVFSCHILYTVYISYGHTICIDIIYLTHFFRGILCIYIYTYSIYIHILYTHLVYISYIHIICRHIVDVYIWYNVDLIQTLHRIALHCITYIHLFV